ncbi:MAG: hypothetical protein HQL60_09415, partial [Magnetococcales bacterium]|nr:hypothetical protein [Magnetococcales bacterium]
GTMAALLSSSIDRIWTTDLDTTLEQPPQPSRCLSSEQIAAVWHEQGRDDVAPCCSAIEALEQALDDCPTSGRIVVTGSLYLVATIRHYILTRSRA